MPLDPDMTLTADATERMHRLYRDLHANPELSMQEHRTAGLIEAKLAEAGIESFRCAGTGVVAVLRNGDGPVVGFRADTDGLPIAEDTGLDYASTVTGVLPDGAKVPVMHGCGHDTHITAAVTVAELLAANRAAWSGTVVFIFQPGEETAAGAAAMVADGLWGAAPAPQVIYGQHVMPNRAGSIHISRGPAMAMADSWKVTVAGRGSHGSQPQDAIDPIVLGAQMVVRLQTIVSREVDPADSAVVTIGTFHAGLKENIIPATAEFTLNVRTFEQPVRDRVLAAIRRIIAAEAQASGAPEPLIEEISTFPACYNDVEEADALIGHLCRVLGDDAVRETPPLMGSEDFGSLATALGVPSVFWMFGGTADEIVDGDGPIPSNHSPHFAPVLEPTLTTGVTAALTALLSKVGSQAT